MTRIIVENVDQLPEGAQLVSTSTMKVETKLDIGAMTAAELTALVSMTPRQMVDRYQNSELAQPVSTYDATVKRTGPPPTDSDVKVSDTFLRGLFKSHVS